LAGGPAGLLGRQTERFLGRSDAFGDFALGLLGIPHALVVNPLPLARCSTRFRSRAKLLGYLASLLGLLAEQLRIVAPLLSFF
jgi:hypothetical protein